ncbi:CBS domain-containing protein [Legionella jordanis]|uniref:Hypoxic response protein 1 n=1 Tax=Legionella jordanis TaxID=456 RepID=A0A0W0VFX0_9GAMM|nr:CBS domain-containing protein [Legionella jordanis]KTD18991.1 Hypoxic response protein 1 [Legionella jordanis]RMX05449.1 CBS domain-containing protein [Legionella jordanis]RMX19133.1 CBS domain-containing protein [Legionella jordanis]VEH13092.1 Hypoxic response protein 1 [Legionella jordanis]
MAHLIFSALPQPRRSIIYVSPTLTAAECVKKMTEDDIGALVVRDEEKLYGIVSERDVLRACLYNGLNPFSTPAADIAFTAVSLLNLFDPVEKAMEVITQTKRRHVLIEDKGEIVAILSIGDLLLHLLEDKTRVIEQLENYIHTY